MILNKNKIFLVIIFMLMCIPMLRIKQGQFTLENRYAAQKPELIIKDKGHYSFNNNFGTEYNNYFNDRFLGRKALINFYTRFIKKFISTSHATKNYSVLYGKDDWVFYTRDGSLRNFANLDFMSDDEMDKIAKKLQAINNWCKKYNKEFYFLIVPEKNKVYGEFYPDYIKKINPDSQSRTMKFMNYLKKHTDVKAYYLADFIIKNKDKGLLYFKNDTHWNDFGSFLVANETIKFTNRKPCPHNTEVVNITHEIGDLSYHDPGLKKDNITKYKWPKFSEKVQLTENGFPKYDRIGDGGTKVQQYINTNNFCYNEHVALFGDSYFQGSFPIYMAESFNKVTKFPSNVGFTKIEQDYIKESNASVIIFEKVERYMPWFTDTIKVEVN